jgi:hypothetical protein
VAGNYKKYRQRVLQYTLEFNMSKNIKYILHLINIIICTFILLYALSSSSFGAARVGNTIYISDTTLVFDCSRVTDGNGVGVGRMRFRIKGVSALVWEAWTEYQDFKTEASINFPSLEVGKEYQVQGQFCDLLGNCQAEERVSTVPYNVKFVKGNIAGTLNIKLDFVLEITP